jgi:hypothetical protein
LLKSSFVGFRQDWSRCVDLCTFIYEKEAIDEPGTSMGFQ